MFTWRKQFKSSRVEEQMRSVWTGP